MKYDMAKIGNNIRTLRKQMNLSIKVLGERTGISPSFIGLTERGKKGMSTEKLCRISNALNITLNELIEGEFSGGKLILKVQEEKKDDVEKLIMASLYGMSTAQKELVLQLVKTIRSQRQLFCISGDDTDDINYD